MDLQEESNILDQNHPPSNLLLPVSNIRKLMKYSLPKHAKISKSSLKVVQECVTEFLIFVAGVASERAKSTGRKTIIGDDIIAAMKDLGFDAYIEPLTKYLEAYRNVGRIKTSEIDLSSQSEIRDDNTTLQTETPIEEADSK